MHRAILILLATTLLYSCVKNEVEPIAQHTPFLNVDISSADSMLYQMTLKEKIGQMIILKSDLEKPEMQSSIYQWIKDGKYGGVLLQGMTIDKYIQVIDSLNQLAKIPLLNGTNQNVLLNNQFSDAVAFPLPPSLGSISNDTIHKELEALYIQQCKALGINFAITPSTNQVQLSDKKYLPHLFENDNKRKFDRAGRVLENLKKENILSLGNRFSDFYMVENDTVGLLDSVLAHQMFLAQNGISGFFLDENIFKIDSLPKLQTFFLKSYLRNAMDFDGLLLGEITAEATLDELIHSGADVFIVKDSVDKVFNYLYQFIQDGLMSEKVLNERVRKILLAKTYANLHKNKFVPDAKKIESVMKNEHYDYFARRLFENSITLAHNYNNLLPYTKTYQRDFRIINVGNEKLQTFKIYFSKYANYQVFNHQPDSTGQIKKLKTIFHKHSTSVVVLDNVDLDTTQSGAFVQSINQLSKTAKLTIINFGNPLNLQYFDTTLTLVQVWEKNDITESLIPQLLFGGMTAQGMLPLTLAEHLPYGKSIATPITRLKYTVPQEVGIAPEKLVGIDAIIQSAISKRATPGAQILVVKDGKVFYNESFGHHTYNRKTPVRNSDLYDLASITKVAATSLASMKLYENQEFKIQDKIKDHFTLEENSTIGKITFKQLFTHSSGLQASIPISRFFIDKDTIIGDCNQYFCKDADAGYSVQVAENMYLDPRWLDSLWSDVQHLKVKRKGRFRYSDANFYLLQKLVEQKTNQPLNTYLENSFYKSLNLRRTTYRPLGKFKTEHIVPTQHDKRWREQMLKGFVHDEGAALMGGVGGHAGLFSNATDLAVLFQMLLNGGTYGDMNFLNPNTIQKFTTASYGNHRGLGFVVKGRRGANSLSSQASRKTFGHTGFTGTCVWVDPENELIYIFLSNRIHPKKNNTRLYRNQTRRRIHDVVYRALDTYQTGEKSRDKVLVSLGQF